MRVSGVFPPGFDFWDLRVVTSSRVIFGRFRMVFSGKKGRNIQSPFNFVVVLCVTVVTSLH